MRPGYCVEIVFFFLIVAGIPVVRRQGPDCADLRQCGGFNAKTQTSRCACIRTDIRSFTFGTVAFGAAGYSATDNARFATADPLRKRIATAMRRIISSNKRPTRDSQ